MISLGSRVLADINVSVRSAFTWMTRIAPWGPVDMDGNEVAHYISADDDDEYEDEDEGIDVEYKEGNN